MPANAAESEAKDPLQCAVLIIGSLFWDEVEIRKKWRERLKMGQKTHVNVPIRYGRNRTTSWGSTYTMIFDPDGKIGQGILVPCDKEIRKIDQLIVEADELWSAEMKKEAQVANTGPNPWAYIGALFRPDKTELQPDWTEKFRQRRGQFNSKLPPGLTTDGLLKIEWPKPSVADANFKAEIILATAVMPSSDPVAEVSNVAKGLLASWDEGQERYFFNNVCAGITTDYDRRIWNDIKDKRKWAAKYPDAVRILTEQEGTVAD